MAENAELDVDTVLEALDALGDGIAIYGPDNLPLFVNKVSFTRFATYYTAMANGGTHRDALVAVCRKSMRHASEADIQAAADRYAKYFMSGQPYMTTTEDGRHVLAHFRKMSRGLKAGYSIDMTDVRMREKELVKAKRAAEAASASKSAFLANMSHEIRTPLNGIMGMAQVLEKTALDDQQRDYLSTILDSGQTLMALLNDVLDLSKIEAGKLDIVRTDADLAHVLRRLHRLWKPRADEKGLELSLALDCDLPQMLTFDAVRVQQCVSNVVSNAIKFTDSGRVTVVAAARRKSDDSHAEGGHMVEIRVIDTGAGMDQETLGRLFKPFVQADETTQRVHGGTGLGLSITRKLCELMGGGATAESEPGRGSTFRITFRADIAAPRATHPAGLAGLESADPRQALRSSNLRVLLVDDHPINRQVAALFLRPYNMRIVEAVNGKEALAALEKETFDIVLLDMHMPIMDGPTCLSHIRASDEAWSDIPVIALTADAMSGDRERYLAMGANSYLSKPLAERDLLSEISVVRSAGGWLPARISKSG